MKDINEKTIKSLINESLEEKTFDDSFKSALLDKINNKAEELNKKRKSSFGFMFNLKFGVIGFFACVIIATLILGWHKKIYQYVADFFSPKNTEINNNVASDQQISVKLETLDLVSPSLFVKVNQDCFESCSAKDLFEKAYNLSNLIDSYKVRFNDNIVGYTVLHEKTRVLTSNDEEIVEKVYSSTSISTRIYDISSKKWTAVEYETPDSGTYSKNIIEPYSYDLILEDKDLFTEYEFSEDSDSNKKVIKITQNSENETITFYITIQKNIYISGIQVLDGKSSNLYIYSDFGQDYGILPAKLSHDLFNSNDAQQIYNSIIVEKQNKFENLFFHYINKKSDEQNNLTLNEGFYQGKIVQSDVIKTKNTLYSNEEIIENVYLGDMLYIRKYDKENDSWSDWTESNDQTLKSDNVRYFANPLFIVNAVLENQEIYKIDIAEGVSDNLKELKIYITEEDYANVRYLLKIVINRALFITRIEIPVFTDEGSVSEIETYDYFLGTDFEEQFQDAFPVLTDKTKFINQKFTCDNYKRTEKNKYEVSVSYPEISSYYRENSSISNCNMIFEYRGVKLLINVIGEDVYSTKTIDPANIQKSIIAKSGINYVRGWKFTDLNSGDNSYGYYLDNYSLQEASSGEYVTFSYFLRENIMEENRIEIEKIFDAIVTNFKITPTGNSITPKWELKSFASCYTDIELLSEWNYSVSNDGKCILTGSGNYFEYGYNIEITPIEESTLAQYDSLYSWASEVSKQIYASQGVTNVGLALASVENLTDNDAIISLIRVKDTVDNYIGYLFLWSNDRTNPYIVKLTPVGAKQSFTFTTEILNRIAKGM